MSQFDPEVEQLRTLALDDAPIGEVLDVAEGIMTGLHPTNDFDGMRITDIAFSADQAASNFFRFLVFHHAGVSKAVETVGTIMLMRRGDTAEGEAKERFDRIRRRLSAYTYAVTMDCMRKADEVRALLNGKPAFSSVKEIECMADQGRGTEVMIRASQSVRAAQKGIEALRSTRLDLSIIAMLTFSPSQEAIDDALRARARRGGKARAKNDKRQAEKQFIEDCWNGWQSGKVHYSGKAAFARGMIDKCEHLVSVKKIEDWCREWEKEHTPS